MMNHSESIAEISKALVRAQSEFQTAQINAVNPFLKNRYADLGAVIEAVRPALVACGLTFLQPASMEDGVVSVETIILHESGEYISESITLAAGSEKGKSAAQVAGSIITYLRRYGLSSMLGIYAGDDSDGAEAPRKRTPQPAQSNARKAMPQPPQEPPLDDDELWNADGSPASAEPTHWIKDPQTRKRFWAWANEQQLTSDDVHAALGVDHVEEFAGDKPAAVAAIIAWKGRPFVTPE